MYFNEFKELVKLQYPSLILSIVEDNITLTGMLYLYDCDGKELDRYHIKIICDSNYPDSIPTVHEIGGRIPKIADRHFFPEKTEACLFLIDESYKYYDRNVSITDFIKEIVEPFFLSQTYYEFEGKWLFGDRRHGVFGVIDFYKEILNTDSLEMICSFLLCLQKEEVKGHWNCFCGSNKIMRRCHFDLVKNFRTKISKVLAKKSFDQVSTYIKNQRKLLKQASSLSLFI